MKKLTVIFFTLLVCFVANAQSQSDSIKEAYSKLQDLESRITLQDAQIAKLLQQVDEVTKQNLALKKNLNLSPTIATAKAGSLMEYRIIEVTGDPETKEVHLVMIADNISGEEKFLRYGNYEIIDDQGHGFENTLSETRSIFKIEGVIGQLLGHSINHQPNAPYTIDIYLNGCNPDIQYIKYIGLDITDGPKHNPIKFENLPIKWNN